MLTTRQIERYSRQIITPGFGSTAQERLLAANVIVVGKLDDVDPVLPYLVGAGAGRVRLNSNSNEPAIASLQSRFKDLNPDVEFANQAGDGCDLVLAIASDETTAQRVADLAKRYYGAALIYARLDAIPAIAVIPSRPPCLRCADSELLAPLTRSCSTPGLPTMIAGLEAIKLLAGMAPAEARLIEFDGYAAVSRVLHQRTGTLSCECPRVMSK